jgi:tetratricopeptide (TPR) repeat protein
MRKLYPRIVGLFFTWLCFSAYGNAQNPQIAARAAEWKSYPPPAANFVRKVDSSGTALFRVPADWKQVESPKLTPPQISYRFTGPNSALLQISVEQISDGLPLRDYLGAIMGQLRNIVGISDSLIVRRTEMAGLEAREIMFELPDESGQPTRRFIWCAVSGPTAVAITFIEPHNSGSELQPYLRAVVQSLIIVEKDKYSAFEALRSGAIKEGKPAPVDQVQSIAASIEGLEVSERRAGVAKLAETFSIAPDSAIDLVLDRRPMVRAATIEAITRSKNRALDPFLLKALQDQEVFVSERGARYVAAMPNVIAALREESLNWTRTEQMARVWPFLHKSLRLQILVEAFAAGIQSSATHQAPGKSNQAAPSPEKLRAPESNSGIGLLTLLSDISASDFKLPLAQVLKAKNDALTAAALQVAIERREQLPVDELIKLLSSTSDEVKRLAIVHLGDTATTADINQVEEFARRIATQQQELSATNDKSTNQNIQLTEEVRASIKKINLRDRLAKATAEQRQQLLKETLADPQLARWVWTSYIRQEEQPTTRSENSRQISPFGENVFPQGVTHYVALPDPNGTIQRLGDSLNGIQLDSARSQASLVLLLTSLHQQLAQEFGAKTDQSVFEYSGINTRAPIALAAWNAAGAPRGIGSAQRKAIILRVADRDRFERSLTLYQKKLGSFDRLPEYVAGGARLLAAVPAMLPFIADVMLKEAPSEPKEEPLLSYDFVGQAELDGQPVKVFVERRVSHQGVITNDSAYLLYVGDAALLAPDLDSLRDALHRVRDGGARLAANAEFKRARESDGDAIYFSSLDELMRAPGESDGPSMNEIGSLKISNTAWESSHHFTFKESTWSKPLVTFHPDELLAPRELLPRSTVMYYFMKIDMAAAWREWGKDVFQAGNLKNFASVWALDIEKEVLPEIGPECGVALLALPVVTAKDWNAPWVAFIKLKSDKLERAFDAGHLFRDAAPKQGIATIKSGSGNFFVTIKSGFLVMSGTEAALVSLDQKEKVAASRDFTKAAKRAPAAVVAFGGYNLELSEATRNLPSDSVRAQGANLILSLTRAFHSPSLYAKAGAGSIDARSSVSMDREGRYSIAELQSLAANSEPAFAVLEPTGIRIASQDRIKSLRLRIHTRAAGEVERIAEDVGNNFQNVEQRSEHALVVRVWARRAEPKEPVELPIKAPEFAPFLQPTKEIRSDDKDVIAMALEIAGTDRDAWSVARKLSDWTFKNLKWKRVDYDAAQALATREADCYEFSKLFVAMARSLGLPARIVSGLAYGGSSFGGHAWVEVYAGSWIEIDPTWGTHFVDATHVRDSSGALITYAALNLVQLEVLEAPRVVEDFQLDATTLLRKLCEELAQGQSRALNAVLDPGVLTDHFMGQGSWATLTDAEREQALLAYQRVIAEISSGFKADGEGGGELRFSAVKSTGDQAQAVLMQSQAFGDMLLKVNLVRREGAWLLSEIVQADTGLNIIGEFMQPAIKEIAERRTGKKPARVGQSDFLRVLLTTDRDPKTAVALADEVLKNNPGDRRLRYLKSLALAKAERVEEAVKLWIDLSDEKPPQAPALFSLAEHFGSAEEAADQKKAIELYIRYLALEPDDSRAHHSLASLYYSGGDYARAEVEYRAAVECDSSNSDRFLNLAESYAAQKKFADAATIIDEAARRTGLKDDLFATLLFRFSSDETTELPEGLAASEPQRMAQSLSANLVLARIRVDHKQALRALPLLKRAVSLDNKSSEPYALMAEAYRQLRHWTAALNAANTAITLSDQDGDAHYERACVLAKLGRRGEAMTALKRAVELRATLAELVEGEADLKSLATLPEFKKLIPKLEKQ